MERVIQPTQLSGEVQLPESKSLSHRRIIAAMLSRQAITLPDVLYCDDTCATLECFKALGATYQWREDGLQVDGSQLFTKNEVLPCFSSASTLRMMLPIVLTHPGRYVFELSDGLKRRSLKAYQDALSQVTFAYEGNHLIITGGLQSGHYRLDGSHSSQFLSGLCFALSLFEEESIIELKNPLVSATYFEMTKDVLTQCGATIVTDGKQVIISGKPVLDAVSIPSQKDASASAFLKVANYLGATITWQLYDSRHQSDEQLDDLLVQLKQKKGAFSLKDSPDLLPALALACSLSEGQFELVDLGRIRDKESDRVHAVYEILTKLGAQIVEKPTSLEITGVKALQGGKVTCFNDHRLIMMVAITSVKSLNAIIIDDDSSVSKSWPNFFQVFEQIEVR